MTSFNAPPKFSRQILMLTAGIFLLGATEGALARDRGNSNDHGGMRSGDSGRDRDHGDKHSEKHEDRNRNGDKNSTLREVRRDKDKGADKSSENHKNKGKDEDKHAEKNRDKGGDKHAEKHKDKDQDKTAGTTTTTSNTPAADGGHVLMDSGIVGKTPTDIVRIPIDPGTGGKPAETATNGGTIPIDPGTGGKMPGDRGTGDKHAEKHKDKDRDGDKHAEKTKDKDKDETSGSTTATSTTPAADGGHVLMDSGIVGKTPTDIVPIDPGTGGKASAGGLVTVSNGVTTYEIPNGPGGVAVYSGSPGTITITNGKESKTLNGGSVTLSGNVVGIGAAQNVQVGARNGEGRTPIAIRPPAPAPAAPARVTTGPGSITVTGSDIKTAGKVISASPAAAVVTAAALPVTATAAAVGLVKGGAAGPINRPALPLKKSVASSSPDLGWGGRRPHLIAHHAGGGKIRRPCCLWNDPAEALRIRLSHSASAGRPSV